MLAVTPGVSPPNPKAAVLDVPQLPKCILASFKSPTSVQLDPSQDSVKAVGVTDGTPPKTNPEVVVPADPPVP